MDVDRNRVQDTTPYHARVPRTGQLPQCLRYRAPPAVVIADNPVSVIPHVLQHLRLGLCRNCTPHHLTCKIPSSVRSRLNGIL